MANLWQFDDKCGAFPDFTLHSEFTSIFFDDGSHIMQAKSGALPGGFGGEKWIKDFFKIFCGDAGTGIGD
jgi:hypothetical protein